MLDFRPIALEDRALFTSYASAAGFHNCEMSFVNHYIWRHRFQSALCVYNGFLYVRMRLCGEVSYMLPMGQGDLRAAIGEIDGPLVFAWMSQQASRRLEADFPGRFAFTSNRNDSDYLYNAADLISLSGKKYHAKRNYVNRLTQLYQGRYEYEPVTKENLCDIWRFEREWCRKNGCEDDLSLMEEQTAVAIALDNLEGLALRAGMIRIDGKVKAFTAGSLINSRTMDVHIEKADYEVPGLYAVVNWEFARRNCEHLTFINREEDMGVEGLRKAKLSYHPVQIVEKITAREV